MTKKTNSSNPQKENKTKKQKTSIFNFFTKNSNNSDTQDSLTSPRSDDDDIERDVSKKEASLKKFKILINKNNKAELEAFLFDKNNKYILHDAVEEKEQGLVEKTLELAKYLTGITYNGSTVLHSAVKGIANLNIIEMLIKAQPNLAYIKDNEYKTPCDHADESIKIKILEYYTECYTESKKQFSAEYKAPHDWDDEDAMFIC